MPRTSGTFATLSPFCARKVDSGVFDVREMPTSTRSAFGRLRGSRPSSLRTVNSTASTRRKYSSPSVCNRPGTPLGCAPRYDDSLAISVPMRSTASTFSSSHSRRKQLAMRRRHDGEHDQRLHVLGAVDDDAHLRLEPHARVHAQLHRHAGELQQRRAHHLLGGLAGRIRDDEDEARLAHTNGVDGSMRTNESSSRRLLVRHILRHRRRV